MSITSERIRENCFIHHLMDAAADDIEALEQELATITKQRDLAVEALKKAVDMVGHPDNIELLQNTIKEINTIREKR